MPKFYEGDIEKTVKELLNKYTDFTEGLEHMLRYLETENIRELSANKISAGTIKALIEIIGPKITGGTIVGETEIIGPKITGGTIVGETEIIGPMITGGTVRTDASPNKRVEISENQVKCYNSSNKLNGFNIDGEDANFGDVSFYNNGKKIFRIYNDLDDNYSIVPELGVDLRIGSSSASVSFRNATFIDSAALLEQSEPDEEEGKLKLWYDGTNFKVTFPNGTVKTISTI